MNESEVRRVTCPGCHGKGTVLPARGAKAGERAPCPNCDGKGYRVRIVVVALIDKECEDCGGSGEAWTDPRIDCPKCNGSGRITLGTRELLIKNDLVSTGSKDVVRTVQCPSCRGLGRNVAADKRITVVCRRCKGKGWVVRGECEVVCEGCEGTGEVSRIEKEACPCGGGGRVNEVVTLEPCVVACPDCDGGCPRGTRGVAAERKEPAEESYCEKCMGQGVLIKGYNELAVRIEYLGATEQAAPMGKRVRALTK